MAPRRLGILAVVLVLVTTPVLAGCGGGEESASEQWAGDVCGGLSTWVTSVQDAVTSLTDSGLSLDAAAVQAATADVREATDEPVDDLQASNLPRRRRASRRAASSRSSGRG